MEINTSSDLPGAIIRLAETARMAVAVHATKGGEPDLVAHVDRRLAQAVAAYDEAREFAASWAALHGGRPRLVVVSDPEPVT